MFLRKTVIGDRNNPSTRLLDDSVIESLGIGFDKLRQIPTERHTIDLQISVDGGMMELQKIDEVTGEPEATELLPIAHHDLQIPIEWPLPGGGGWTEPPTEDYPWRIAPGELFDLDGKEKIDCSSW